MLFQYVFSNCSKKILKAFQESDSWIISFDFLLKGLLFLYWIFSAFLQYWSFFLEFSVPFFFKQPYWGIIDTSVACVHSPFDGIWIISSFFSVVNIKTLWTLVYKSLWELNIFFLLNKYWGVCGRLDHVLGVCLTFHKVPNFSIVVIAVYIPTSIKVVECIYIFSKATVTVFCICCCFCGCWSLKHAGVVSVFRFDHSAEYILHNGFNLHFPNAGW